MKKIAVLFLIATTLLFPVSARTIDTVGGQGRDFFLDVVEVATDIVSVGHTSSPDIASNSYGGNGDGLLSSRGRHVYDIYVGGSDFDELVAVDGFNFFGEDFLVVAGNTMSNDIVASNLYNGGGDTFVGAYNLTGFRYWQIYIGGSGLDFVTDIAVDNNYIYISGYTNSSDFAGGGVDFRAFVMKINAQGSVLWTSFVDGNGDDKGVYISVENGLVYLASTTTSTDLSLEQKSDGPTSHIVSIHSESDGAVQSQIEIFAYQKFHLRGMVIINGIIYYAGMEDGGGVIEGGFNNDTYLLIKSSPSAGHLGEVYFTFNPKAVVVSDLGELLVAGEGEQGVAITAVSTSLQLINTSYIQTSKPTFVNDATASSMHLSLVGEQGGDAFLWSDIELTAVTPIDTNTSWFSTSSSNETSVSVLSTSSPDNLIFALVILTVIIGVGIWITSTMQKMAKNPAEEFDYAKLADEFDAKYKVPAKGVHQLRPSVCTVCGTKLEPDDVFCTNCGTQV